MSVSMASSVEEQSATTEEIRRTVEGVAARTSAIIAGIGEVPKIASATGRLAEDLSTQTGDLGEQAQKLSRDVASLLDEIRAEHAA
jgi:methyl-accepting chemotaxis protein